MTDRELLELAAKAAGMRYYYASYQKHLHVEHQHTADGIHWNPLTDDGDALRLAVKLRLVISSMTRVSVIAYEPSTTSRREVYEPIGLDPYAATRRAITRAAAEIGRSV